MSINITLSKAMNRSDMITMLTTLSWMLGAGISIKDGVDKLLEDPNNKMNKHGLEVLRDELEEGKQLSEIFRDHEEIYGEGRWRQIDAAERTGKTAACLERIAGQIQNDGDLMGKVRNAAAYPAIIMLFALAAGYYMFTTIVPQMGSMLEEFEVSMPPLTVAVMSFSNFLIDNVIIIVVILVVFGVTVRYLLTHNLKFQWHKLITKLPLIGAISVNMNYSLVYTLLSDMIENGAHVVEALRVAAGSASNIYIMGELLAASELMEREGFGITDALIKTSTMPSDDKLMLQVGSDTGRELELLNSLSERRRSAAYASVNALMEVMPTFVLVLVAVVVGTMVIAIYMPMISMATDMV